MSSYTPSAGTPSAAPRGDQRTPTLPPRPVVAPRDPLAQSLVGEFLTEQKEEREAAARKRRAPRPWRRIASIAAIVACGILWFAPSLGTRPIPALSAGRLDASARLTLFLASQRVRDFQQRNGRLPRSTRESGISDARIAYRPTSASTFTVSLTGEDGQRWDLPSTAADTAYLRDVLARLARQPK